MSEHPLIFQGWGVRAILEGRKTMTRRIGNRYRNWKKGDLIWVKETWNYGCGLDNHENCDRGCIKYKADEEYEYEFGLKWKSSMFMPHWASRITICMTADAKEERLQEITDNDAQNEGVETDPIKYGDCCYVDAFIRLWDSLAKPGYKWTDNPLLWVIQFERMEQCKRPILIISRIPGIPLL
jgi:hypothetical protein